MAARVRPLRWLQGAGLPADQPAAAPAQSRAASALDRLGHVLSGALLLGLAVLFAISIRKFVYYNPIGLPEEAAYTYTSSHNYLRYGFLHSLFLQDFSNSSNPADHPYVYDHMPAGPDVFTGLLFKVFGENNYAAERITFALLFVAGIAVYLKFVSILLRGFGLRGASWAVLFIGPWILFQTADRQPSGPFPLLLFTPLVCLDAYYRTSKRRCLWLAMAVALGSSVYLEYLISFAGVLCWLFLYVTQLMQLRPRHLIMFLTVMISGLALHFVQNVAYLGLPIFQQELAMTIGNRLAGVPTQAQMNDFYRQIGVVSHGSHPLNVRLVLSHLRSQVSFRGAPELALSGIAALAWVIVERRRKLQESLAQACTSQEIQAVIRWFVRVGVWICGIVVLPVVLLPAYSQEVTLSGYGANRYFLAVGVIAAFGYVLRTAMGGPSASAGGRGRAAAGMRLALLLGLLACVGEMIYSRAHDASDLVSAVQASRYTQLAALRDFSGQFFMTNINLPIVGYFTQQAGEGVCGLDALPDTGDVDWSKCKVAFVRRQEYYATLRPRYFFFFTAPDLFPGFADCLPAINEIGDARAGADCVPEMHQRLMQRFPRVLGNGLVEVFDLGGAANR